MEERRKYAMLEHENVPGVVESLKIVTEPQCERLCKYAFDWARENGRKKVTLIHKANIMKVTDGLFLEVSKRVAKDYPDIKHEQMIIDNCCMQLVSNPWQFDVMILTNLYGTIVTNLVCGLIGGPGTMAGINVGPRYAIFEPATRNTGSSLAGKNIANPSAILNAGADLLNHLGFDYHGGVIRDAVDKTINVDKIHTVDLGGEATTCDVVQNVIDQERDRDFCLSAERDLERLYDLSLLTGEYVGEPLDLRGDLERDRDLDLDLLDELPPPP